MLNRLNVFLCIFPNFLLQVQVSEASPSTVTVRATVTDDPAVSLSTVVSIVWHLFRFSYRRTGLKTLWAVD